MKKIYLLIVLFIVFTGCVNEEVDEAFDANAPKTVLKGKIYSLVMYSNATSSLNKNYLKFKPDITSYFSIHIGTKDSQDIDIKVYSDIEHTNLIKSSNEVYIQGEVLTFNAKANQDYFIVIVNYDNTRDTEYDLLISANDNSNYTKEKPLEFELDKSESSIMLNMGYDSLLNLFDNDDNKIYMIIDSKKTENLYLKTKTLNANQDLDIKVFADDNYTNEIYTSSSVHNTDETLEVNFDYGVIYYVLIENFTNDNESKIIFEINNE